MRVPGNAGFVLRQDSRLILDQKPFRLAGANSYYFAFSAEQEQRRILGIASDFGFNVLRIWAFHDFQREGSPGPGEVCFQFLPSGGSIPEIIDSDDGLRRLDRAVQLAAEFGIRLILTLTNYHADYGGLPQYQKWFGLPGVDETYRNLSSRLAYQAYSRSIITRSNTLTGKGYADDSTILAWEIINEPRCPSDAPHCTVVTDWLHEMSAYIRSLAPRQLIAAGDEGFFNRRWPFAFSSSAKWLYNGSVGVDTERILELPDIDLGTFHLYPTQWGAAQNAQSFGERWIEQHAQAARAAGKPVILEEFGLPSDPGREAIYDSWLRLVEEQGLAGDLVWMLGLPGKGDEYLLADAWDSPALREHAARFAT